jgi:rhodanese-related sulfurtransferase
MPTDLQRDQVQRLQAKGALLVEVLPRDEYDREHIAGALNLPLGEITRDNAERVLVRDRPIVVYCHDIE